ncbi:MAG: recombinase family protein [Limisphaerales bacterium]
MTQCYGYIRVSTAKQGEHGVSLQEQRDAIVRYAEKNQIAIASWFEERETAAKRGRPVFNDMLRRLRHGQAQGVILHKIDRGARNLKDWADLVELFDSGITVHCANEGLDLASRGGRLSADIQAVVAADYIRNLREETRKGFYGRIKQGFLPLPAPVGYLDKGAGKAKEPDPASAPLVRKAFELYATGRHNLHTLEEELYRLGLRTRRGGRIGRASLSLILNNPFYIGLIRLKRTGETFPGAHAPLIPKSLFDRVHAVLRGHVNARTQCHDFLFRRLLACTHCGYSLIGERQKGHQYYRCHTAPCPTTGIREEAVDEALRRLLVMLRFDERERAYFTAKLAQKAEEWGGEREAALKTLSLRQAQLQDRLSRLTDAFLDATIEKPLFEERKTALLMERKSVEEQMAKLRQPGQAGPNRLAEFLELAGRADLLYQMGLADEKRDLVKIVTSNRRVAGKTPEFTLAPGFLEVAKRWENSNGAPYRDIPRTWDRLLDTLAKLSTLGQLPVLPAGVGCRNHDNPASG